MGYRWRSAAIEQVANIEALSDVVPSDIGVAENLFAIAVRKHSPLANQVAAIGDLEGLTELVVSK